MLKADGDKSQELTQWRGWRRFDRMLLRYAALTSVILALVLLSFAWIEHLNALARDYQRIRFDVQALLENQVDEETGLRGYQITGSPVFLTPYNNARGQIEGSMRGLEERIDDRSARQALLDFGRRHDRWLQAVATPVLVRPGGPVSQTREAIGRVLVDAMRADVAAIDAVYLGFRARTLSEARFFEILCVSLIVLAAFVVALFAYRSERAAARHEEQLLAGIIDTRDSATRVGEWRNRVVAMLAHDFKSTLGVIKAYCNLLEDFPEKRADPTIYTSIEHAIGELADMSDEALLMARVTGGSLAVASEALPISDIVGEVIARYRGEREISFEAADVYVGGDRPYLVRVFDNLLSNAVKYSPDATRVDVRVLPDNDGVVKVLVTNRGRGVDPDDLAHVFDEYWRAPDVGDRKGTGVGLFIVKKIVEAHGGRIEIESRVGEETTLTVSLPAAKPKARHADADSARLG